MVSLKSDPAKHPGLGRKACYSVDLQVGLVPPSPRGVSNAWVLARVQQLCLLSRIAAVYSFLLPGTAS